MNRSWHHWETWECVPAGMYATVAPSGISSDDATHAYTQFLNDLGQFMFAMRKVMREWPIACEQFLTNHNINRIAWLGQSAMCMEMGIPACFRAGFARLTPQAQQDANALAMRYLNAWLDEHDENPYVPESIPVPKGLHNRIAHYTQTWQARGYPNGLPNEVSPELMRLNLAPSHKAIALAVLKNDHALSSLGYSQPISPWYGVIKRLELETRNAVADPFFT